MNNGDTTRGNKDLVPQRTNLRVSLALLLIQNCFILIQIITNLIVLCSYSGMSFQY